MPFGLGVFEIVLIVAAFVLLFGARRIPLIARGLGKGIRNFKGEMKESPRDREISEGEPEDGRDR